MTNERIPRQSRAQRLSESLLRVTSPTFNAWHIAEPKLVFANQQLCEDPKTGISEFGPAALDGSPRTAIRIGVIGNGDSIQRLKNWVESARSRIYPGLNSKQKPFDPLFAPSFPGFGLDSPYGCEVVFDSRLTVTLTERELVSIVGAGDFTDRVRTAIGMISAKLGVLADREPAPDVVVLAMPKELEDAIGPDARAGQSRVVRLTPIQRKEKKRREADVKRGQLHFRFDDDDATNSDADKAAHQFRDFHNSIKAHAMRSGLATQLVWHSTLARSRGKEDPATTAWNFFTALYYKSGNVPWRLNFGLARTCYVGITFYRESADPDAPTRTCLAQAFSESGEGLVLRGEQVTWDKDRDKKPHLNRNDAETLLRRVLELYRQHFDEKPNRVVLHKTSRYWPDELEGFKAALGDIHSYDFLALERRGIRFLRLGKEPPVRGTVLELGGRDYLVYTQGYVPFMRQYPGMRIPNPLEVVEHFGDSSAERVCSEILALTKLNWNTCKFSSADPITTSFSRQVATILKELPEDVVPATKYRFYM